MNINDIELGENTVRSLTDIFKHQHELYLKYKEIEGMEWEGDTVNIHTLNGQKWIKDFLWRVTEEITESFEAFVDGHQDHAIEELADSLHFFVELCILVGLSSKDLSSIESVHSAFHATYPDGRKIEDQYWASVYHMGLAANCLKNKPWKKHQMKTDRVRFETYLMNSYKQLLGCFFVYGVKPEKVYDYYFRKSQVNKFRQRSNY